VWHASISVGGRPVDAWTAKEKLRASQLLAWLVDGVGWRVAIRETGFITIQLRKLASEAERLVIGPTRDLRPEKIVGASTPRPPGETG